MTDVREAIALAELIGRIEKIDPEAAQWMRDNTSWIRGRSRLSQAFLWEKTPQGHWYWASIAHELDEQLWPPQAVEAPVNP